MYSIKLWLKKTEGKKNPPTEKRCQGIVLQRRVEVVGTKGNVTVVGPLSRLAPSDTIHSSLCKFGHRRTDAK
jgi:hypothetical protein